MRLIMHGLPLQVVEGRSIMNDVSWNGITHQQGVLVAIDQNEINIELVAEGMALRTR